MPHGADAIYLVHVCNPLQTSATSFSNPHPCPMGTAPIIYLMCPMGRAGKTPTKFSDPNPEPHGDAPYLSRVPTSRCFAVRPNTKNWIVVYTQTVKLPLDHLVVLKSDHLTTWPLCHLTIKWSYHFWSYHLTVLFSDVLFSVNFRLIVGRLKIGRFVLRIFIFNTAWFFCRVFCRSTQILVDKILSV